MDHVMEKIESFYSIYLEDFLEEQLKHDYKKLSENSYYKELKLLADSINMYREYLGLPKIKLSAEVEAVLGRRMEDG